MEKGDDGIYERNGQKFHFTIQVRDYEEERVDIANVMSDMLKQAGVEMEVKLVTKFDWDAGYNGFLAGYATQFDPDMAYVNFVTDASGNNTIIPMQMWINILRKAVTVRLRKPEKKHIVNSKRHMPRHLESFWLLIFRRLCRRFRT